MSKDSDDKPVGIEMLPQSPEGDLHDVEFNKLSKLNCNFSYLSAYLLYFLTRILTT